MEKLSCDTIATRATSSCGAQCSPVVHSNEEAKCLGKNARRFTDMFRGCGQKVAECKAETPPTSCVLSTASKVEETCKEMCTYFDSMCETSGTTADCQEPTAAGAWSPR